MGIQLSIAIPSYNRAKELREMLECLLPQVLKHKEEVEIVISDNASPETDNTEEVVKELQEKYNFPINYKKLEKGIYFEDNFKAVVSRTTGKYVHMTGDDDLFAPDFIDVLFSLMEKEYGLIHFNRLSGNSKCSDNILSDKIQNSLVFTGPTADFAMRVMRAPGFMSSLVFRKDCWDEGEKFEKPNYYGYHFLGRLYQGAMSLGLDSCYYYMPLLIQRGGNHDWGKMFPLFYFVGYSNIFKDCDALAPGILKKWLDFIQTENKRQHLNYISSVRRDLALYREKAEEMDEFLNPQQKKLFHFAINSKLPDSIIIRLMIYYIKFACR